MNLYSEKYKETTRHQQVFKIDPEKVEEIKEKILYWCSRYNIFSFLDNNQYEIPPNRYELLAGVQPIQEIQITDSGKINDWLFGQLDFEYHREDQGSYHAFIPETVIYIYHRRADEMIIESIHDCDGIFHEIMLQQKPVYQESSQQPEGEWSVGKDEYLNTVEKIRQDIYEGRYYELNYCIPCTLRAGDADATRIFLSQKAINPSPFSALYKSPKCHIICQSPERFLYREKRKIVCQPIKGTSSRSPDPHIDMDSKNGLYNSVKDRAENVMIVDLTRNDLYRCCEQHSVEVPELFGIYSFPFVHQMISTVSGTLKEEMSFSDILEVTYPMGSMTGAPKKAVIEHISKYEKARRGAYSGTVFYIQPDGNFDSNVVIRSLIYDTGSALLHFHTGGAITFDSTAQSEWEEIQMKSRSMLMSMR